jgi:asparagine synthase (glutamine-hydrolysing)
MCGIAGMIGACDAQAVRMMTQMLHHRGPDDGAVWFGEDAGVGHRRLKIIDLSDNARQPMCSADGRFVLVYNGEIFNYRPLREQLQGKGHVFRSSSDSEVLLHACMEWGEDVTGHLVGQFAFAFYDTQTRALLLARDHLGIKPLYYVQSGSVLYFASEIKALAAVLPGTRVPRMDLLPRMLTFLWNPGEETMFSGVQALPAGTRALWRDGVLKRTQYWDVMERWKELADNSLPPEKYEEELRRVLAEALRSQLVSDVPLGLLLSGGVDSTILLAEMAEEQSTPHTFTATYDSASRNRDVFDDDLPYARLAAGAFDANLMVETLQADVPALLPEAIWHCDQPLADPTIVTNLALTRSASRGLTVLLSGMGADELFAGYPRYPAVMLGETLHFLPSPIFRAASGMVAGAMRLGLLSVERGRRPLQLLRHLHKPYQERFLGYSTYFSIDELRRVCSGDQRAETSQERLYSYHHDLFARSEGLSPLSRMLAVDLCSFLPFLNLQNMDKTSMANAVEMRVPFLDHRLVELSMQLPDGQKLRGTDERKVLLRRTWKGRIPDSILQRPKTGYSPPVRGWMRGPLRGYARDILFSQRARERGIFDVTEVERLFAANTAGHAEHSMQLWTLLVVELWMRTFTDHRTWMPAADPAALPVIQGREGLA